MDKTKILIVDDTQVNIQNLSELLRGEDVEIVSTTDPNDALVLLSKNDFGLALLDVEMPLMSGFELARKIRSVQRYRNLPLIFATAYATNANTIFEGYDTGAVDILFKPLDPNVVCKKVRFFVEVEHQKRKLIEQVTELERLRQIAETANQAKTEFLANMSHEIRTPLAAVHGFSKIILESPQMTVQERELYSNAIERNTTLLLRLIDDILDLSKVEANKLEFENIEFNLNELLSDFEATMTLKASQKEISINLQGPEPIATSYIGDPTRIKQILFNITGNAIKFTKQGSVSVECHIEAGREVDLFTIHVRDQGIGIEPQHQSKLFELFSQGDPSMNRSFGGAGLGLVISRRIAHALGGDVMLVSSEKDKGSLFKIELPLKRHNTSLGTGAVSAAFLNKKSDGVIQLNGKKVLAVDDSQDNLILIDVYLQKHGAKVMCVESGEKALNAAVEWKPDLILLDIQMPQMDGHETVRELRKRNIDVPVIALTANTIERNKEIYLNSGFNDALNKPVNFKQLLSSLQDYLEINT